MREPDLDDPTLKIFESYPEVPQAVPLDITAETVETVASRLSGAAGPSGTDAVDSGPSSTDAVDFCNWIGRGTQGMARATDTAMGRCQGSTLSV